MTATTDTTSTELPGAKLLRVWMASTRTSATELAKTIKVSRAYLSHLRCGTRAPGRRLAAELARATGGAVPMTAWDEPAGEVAAAVG